MNLRAKKLRSDVIKMLRTQGYEVNKGLIKLPPEVTKEDLRNLNKVAVNYRIQKVEPVLRRHEDELLKYIANGDEITPEQIKPKLVYVESDSNEALLYRYASIHWSIPVSSGYGRRLRFLVIDEENGKLIGLFGLCDPVYSIRKRDEYIGWSSRIKKEKLFHVMDVNVLGAVPPYSSLLCGKLIALLTLSNEVRMAFRKKYSDKEAIISGRIRKPWLVMLTTTSALGRSSIYNRIKLDGHKFWRSLGFTEGSGEFHFTNGVYEQIKAFAESNCEATAKRLPWGKGFRNRREVIKKCLPRIGLSSRLLYHGIRREIFAAPLGQDSERFLRRETGRPRFFDWPAEKLVDQFMERWLLPRAERVPEFCNFHKECYRIWPNS